MTVGPNTLSRGPWWALVLLACAPWAVAKTPWPEVPDPPKAKVEWVAEEAVINGLPSRIESFDSTLSTPEILAYYRAHWAHSREGAAREAKMGDWNTLTTLQGPFQIVLQVQSKPNAKAGSFGLLSVGNFGEARKDFYPKSMPMWSDATVVQVMESTDGPKRSEYVVLNSRESLDLNVKRSRDEWQRRGFEMVRESTLPGAGQDSWTASFNRGRDQLDVTVARQPKTGRTTVVNNLVTPIEN